MERAAQGLALKLGDEAPYFSLKGTDGRIHTISDFEKARALLVVFTCNHCPYSQAYEPRLIGLANKYQPEGVQFIAICANDWNAYPQDSYEHMVEKAKTLNLPYPYLHDDAQTVARAYDAACTPECFLFDSKRHLVYHGRVDDNHHNLSLVESPDLANALEAVLAGTTPEVQLTSVIGCSIKWRR